MLCPECGNPLQRDPESNKEALPCSRPGCVCGHKGDVMRMPRFENVGPGWPDVALIEWHRVETDGAWAWVQRQ